MATQLLEKGEQPAMRRMANDVISAQSDEIAELRRWRKARYGSAGNTGDSMHGSDDSMHGDNSRRADHPAPHERRIGRGLRVPAGAVAPQ